MNKMRRIMKDPYVVMLVTLTAKIEEQAEMFEDWANEIRSLSDERDHVLDSCEKLRQECDELTYKVDRLENDVAYWKGQTAIFQRQAIPGATSEDLDAWMAKEGMEMYVDGGRIACIKVVREKGRIGLKEAKDYAEAYVASHTPNPD